MNEIIICINIMFFCLLLIQTDTAHVDFVFICMTESMNSAHAACPSKISCCTLTENLIRE